MKTDEQIAFECRHEARSHEDMTAFEIGAIVGKRLGLDPREVLLAWERQRNRRANRPQRLAVMDDATWDKIEARKQGYAD